MKAMEDQVVQEEPGYQDDEVNLQLIEKYVWQILFEGILIVLRDPQRDRRSTKIIREFNAFKILFQSNTRKISFSVPVQPCFSSTLH